MIHSFDVDIAEQHGVEAAVIIQNLDFWLSKNKANQRNYHDGRYWTYNSASAFSKLFPYWPSSKIRRLLRKLEDNDVILTGNYNSTPYDRTLWYSFTDAFTESNTSILQICKIEDTQGENRKNVSEQPIPDSKPDNNSYGNTDGDEVAAKRNKKKADTHPTLNVPMNQTRYDNLCSTYSQPVIDSYIQKAIDYCDAKGKKYYSDFAAAAAQYIARDEREGKGPEKRKPRQVCSSCGRPRVGTEGSCMYCLDGQFVEAS